MTSGANEPANPFLSTPFAAVAAQILGVHYFKRQGHEDGPKYARRLKDEIAAIVDSSEALVAELVARGHLPRQMPVEADAVPKADDATLFVQAQTILGARWEPYSLGDPRGEICFDGIRYMTKAVKGVPAIPEPLREKFEGMLAPLLRRL